MITIFFNRKFKLNKYKNIFFTVSEIKDTLSKYTLVRYYRNWAIAVAAIVAVAAITYIDFTIHYSFVSLFDSSIDVNTRFCRSRFCAIFLSIPSKAFKVL